MKSDRLNTLMLEDFKCFKDLMEQDANNTAEDYYISYERLFISVDSPDGDLRNTLMLRYHGESLIIANIEFIHKRMGYGQKLLSLLNEFGATHNFDFIEIESALSDEIVQFAKKYNFVEKNSYSKNWVKGTSNL